MCCQRKMSVESDSPDACYEKKKKNRRKKIYTHYTHYTLHTDTLCVCVCVIHHIDRLLSHTFMKALTFARGGPKHYTNILQSRNKAKGIEEHWDFNFDATKTPLKLRELATKHTQHERHGPTNVSYGVSEQSNEHSTRPSVSLAGSACVPVHHHQQRRHRHNTIIIIKCAPAIIKLLWPTPFALNGSQRGGTRVNQEESSIVIIIIHREWCEQKGTEKRRTDAQGILNGIAKLRSDFQRESESLNLEAFIKDPS